MDIRKRLELSRKARENAAHEAEKATGPFAVGGPIRRRSGNVVPQGRSGRNEHGVGRAIRRKPLLSKGSKLTSASIVRTLCRDLPGMAHATVHRIWHAALRVMCESLVGNTPVVIHGVGTVQPYVRKGGKKFDMRSEATLLVPDRRYIRFIPSKGLLTAIRHLPTKV